MIYYYDGGDEMECCKKIIRSDEEKRNFCLELIELVVKLMVLRK